MIRVGIVGGTGYTGVELLRLLCGHPDVGLQVVTSRQEAGSAVADLFPSLRGYTDLHYLPPEKADLKACDLVFFATPNGTSMTQVPALLAAGVRVIDLAADFRLQDKAVWQRWYGQPHACPELLAEAVYGLPEMNRERIKQARLIANPGCYVTAVTLGLLPLIEAGLVDFKRLIADAKSGISGAGRDAETYKLYGEAGDNFHAYGVSGHRHQPEIVQNLAMLAGRPVELTFVPHLVPMLRGIHATLYAALNKTDTDIQLLYTRRYADEPFVDVMPPGSHPETRSVRGVNMCRIAIHRPFNGGEAVILAVIDNLVKGAAGQAMQNMNLMFNLPETRGLTVPALVP